MSFNDATEFLSTYRTNRILALNNEARMSWALTEADSLDSVFTETFSTKDENSEWDKENGKDHADILKLRALQLRTAFVAGCHRDMRILFAVGEDNRQRLPVDHDRFEYMRLTFGKAKTELLKQVVEKQAEGLKGV